MRQNTTDLTQRSVSGCNFLTHFIFKKWKTNLPTKSLSTERAGHLTSCGKGHKGYTKFLLAFALSNSAEYGLACEKVWPFCKASGSTCIQAAGSTTGASQLLCPFCEKSKNGNFLLLLFH